MGSSTAGRAAARALRISIFDGVLAALMAGASESYFGACAVSLGHADTQLALLATLPLFAGAVAQAFSGPLLLVFGSRRRLVATGALVQAFTHLGFIAISLTSVHSFPVLLALVSVYFISGMLTVPAWGAWMGALTEHCDRERYFALRSTCVSISMLAAFLWGGYRLRAGVAANDLSHAYAWLFGVGFVARLGSTWMLLRQPDPTPLLRDSLARMRARTRAAVRSEGFRLPLVLGLWMLGAHISIPFYAPYMLKTLALGYQGFALVCAAQLVVKAIAFPFTHHIANRYGLHRLLIGSMAMAAVVAFAWGTLTTVRGLLVAQALSGAAWAGYEFASFQLLLRSGRASQRVEFLAMAASFGGLMQLAGAVLGSLLLAQLHLHYREVFLVSALGRALPLLLFVPVLVDGRALFGSRSRTLARD
jgi:MFS family permease